MVTGVELVTPLLTIENTGEEVAPAATVTVLGKVTSGLELLRATMASPVGAGPSRLIRLAVEVTPPAMVADAREMLLTAGLRIENKRVRSTPL